MDFVNNQFPENRIFQHEETFTSTTKDEHYEVDRGKLEADANRYNEQYNISDRVHPGMDHNEYMDAVAEYNKTHPDNPITNPDELLRAAYNSQNGRIYH